MEQKQFQKLLYEYTRLISLYLNSKQDPDYIIDQDNLSFFLKMSKYHSLDALLFKVMKEVKPQIKESYLKKLEEPYLLNVRKVASFNNERKSLYAYLNEKEVDFLPLKGIILKDYYPDECDRQFADNDILFDAPKDDLVKAFFIKNGYKVEYYRKSNHDVYQKAPFYNFEMHRALFGETDDNEKIIKYFNDYLNKAPVKQDKEHYLSNEDFYIYFTAHSYKHYHVSGCGIRTLIDYYLFLKKHPDLDFNYINLELSKLDLLDFSNLIRSVSIKTFNLEPLNKEEEDTLMFIASSGTYGTLEHAVDQGVKKKGKFGYFMSRIFPPYSFYKSAYPWAYKTVILIPIAWLCRFFRILFKNPKRATTELNAIRKHKKDK